jgi:hypothetical protein
LVGNFFIITFDVTIKLVVMKKKNLNASILKSRYLLHQTKDLRQYRVADYRPLFFISLFVNTIVLLSAFSSEPKVVTEYKTIVKETLISDKVDDIELNDDAILKELIDQGCVLPNVALAQFKIESQHFKSSICKENKNIAGIKTSRSEYVAGKNREHCVYKTYRDCIKDYIRIQNRYLENIDGRYAEDGQYVALVKKM